MKRVCFSVAHMSSIHACVHAENRGKKSSGNLMRSFYLVSKDRDHFDSSLAARTVDGVELLKDI